MKCEKHTWVHMHDDRYQCKECGIWGRECARCEGSGWNPPPPGGVCDTDCQKCDGDGVIPDTEAIP